MEVKQCTKCKEVKAVSEYYKDVKKKDGLNIYCKCCQKEMNRLQNIKIGKNKGVYEEIEKLRLKGLKKCSKCKDILNIDNFNKSKKE